MHEQRSPEPADDDLRIDSAILALMLSDRPPWLWSTAELAREIGDELATIDSLRRLHASGLVHRCGDFVFATRTALAFDALPL
jgi:hypothetical protein